MKIIAIGRNYAEHAKELNNPIPTTPVIFLKPDTAVLKDNKPFYIPDFSDDVHFELEVVLKICKEGKHIAEKFAANYYDEIGLGIDFTARDIQSKHKEKGLPWELAKAGIAVYSPHTALDNTPGGINDLLARRLGLADVRPLRRQETAACQVVVFVPEADWARVAEAMFAAGAGNIGQYSQCSFRSSGTGTFFGSEQSNPTVGQKGRREEVNELRLEAVCPLAKVDKVVAALRLAHSYEEPAVDVYPLRPTGSKHGQGRVGHLPQPLTLGGLANLVQNQLQAKLVQVVGQTNRPITQVAIACGAGGEFLNDAVGAGADALLTGEARFHECLAAQSLGLALLLPGHYASERCGIEELAALLQQQWPQTTTWASRAESDPLQIT